jgi:hypothetical protein
MATFLMACFFLGGSFDRFVAPGGVSGFTLEGAVTGLALGVLLILLIWALIEASGYIYRSIRGIP